MFKNWGLPQLDKQEYKWSIDAMKLADDLIERILFLEGLPNLQDLGKLLIGEDVVEALRNDQKLQLEAQAMVRDGIVACEHAKDFVSRKVLRVQLDALEEQIDWLETQLWLVEEVGRENYLQSQL